MPCGRGGDRARGRRGVGANWPLAAPATPSRAGPASSAAPEPADVRQPRHRDSRSLRRNERSRDSRSLRRTSASCGRWCRKATVVRDYLFPRQPQVAKYFNRTSQQASVTGAIHSPLVVSVTPVFPTADRHARLLVSIPVASPEYHVNTAVFMTTRIALGAYLVSLTGMRRRPGAALVRGAISP